LGRLDIDVKFTCFNLLRGFRSYLTYINLSSKNVPIIKLSHAVFYDEEGIDKGNRRESSLFSAKQILESVSRHEDTEFDILVGLVSLSHSLFYR